MKHIRHYAGPWCRVCLTLSPLQSPARGQPLEVVRWSEEGGLCHPGVWPLASPLTSLSFSFLLYKLGTPIQDLCAHRPGLPGADRMGVCGGGDTGGPLGARGAPEPRGRKPWGLSLREPLLRALELSAAPWTCRTEARGFLQRVWAVGASTHVPVGRDGAGVWVEYVRSGTSFQCGGEAASGRIICADPGIPVSAFQERALRFLAGVTRLGSPQVSGGGASGLCLSWPG